jgi:hypothetical protein
VRVKRIGVIEPFLQLANHRLGVSSVGQPYIVSYQRIDEALCHAIALWACHRCHYRLQAHLPGKAPDLSCCVAASAISQRLIRLSAPWPPDT